jgi:hypothetical protein
VGIHHQNWLRERDRLDAELYAIEEKAGVRARHAAFVEYHGDRDLQASIFLYRQESAERIDCPISTAKEAWI